MTGKRLFLKLLRRFVRVYYERINSYYQRYTSEYFTELVRTRVTHCGHGVEVNGEVYISDYSSTIIGNNVHIGKSAYLMTSGGLVIGDNTHISRNVTIYTGNHNYEGEAIPYDRETIHKPVFIGRNVWIGMSVSVCPGVTIGEGAIIAMGAVVNRDVKPYEIVGNQSIKTLKNRDQDRYRTNNTKRRYSGSSGKRLSEKELSRFRSCGMEKGKNMFFVLGTGRSGSATIANTLSKNPKITCLHEPTFPLVRLSTEYAHGNKNREDVKKELKFIYRDTGIFPQGIYGESDMKCSNLVEIIAEILPKAKFIWLIRDGRDVVSSGYSRGWFDESEYTANLSGKGRVYSGKAWSRYRINGYLCGQFSEEEWKDMSSFERNCWYWQYWNELIEQQLNSLPKEQWIQIKLENLSRELSKVESFLGTDRGRQKVEKANVAQYKLRNSNSWSVEQKAMFQKWCGAGMNRWYNQAIIV